MSTLDGPIWSKYSIALNYPARSHFQRTLSKERWVQGWDERYAHQEKKKNEETKRALKRPERGEERRPILEKTVYCLSAVVQEAARRKNGSRRVPGVTGTLGKANSHFDPTQTGLGTAPPR